MVKILGFIFCLIFVFATLLINPLFSQVDSDDYSLIWYSIDNNILPQRTVKDIVKDNRGFIRMPIESGLIRYDGIPYYGDLNTANIEIKGIAGRRKIK